MNNNILIAYCHDNESTALHLGAQLAGFEVAYLNEAADVAPGQFAYSLQNSEGPVALLVTDNFLRSERCMSGILAAILGLLRQNRIAVILADGTDLLGEPKETHIDRVVNAIQYMNYWQTLYLQRSDAFNHTSEENKADVETAMDITHAIANQIGELITALRDSDPMRFEQLLQNNFEPVYRMFQVPRPVQAPVQVAEPVVVPSPEPTPIPKATLQPASVAAVTFMPITPLVPLVEKTNPEISTPEPATKPELPPTQPIVESTINLDLPLSDAGQYPEEEIQRTIQDAWFWIDRGNKDLGIGVLEVAVLQYPDHQQLQAEYERAKSVVTTDAAAAETSLEEARSYEVAGDSAFEKQDYLMAKYCWDRAAEVQSNLPGIYKKLGFLTQDNLSGYNETSLIYLQKALEQDPADAEVRSRLGLEPIEAVAAIVDLEPQTQEVSEPTSESNTSEPTPVAETTELVPDPTPEVVFHSNSPFTTPDEVQELAHIEALVEAEIALNQAETPVMPVPEPLDTNEGVANTTSHFTMPDEEREIAHVEALLEEEIALNESEKPVETQPEVSIVPNVIASKGIVLITGATSGIGRATAVEYARHGYSLILTGRRAERLEAIRLELESTYSVQVLCLCFDVRNQPEVEQHLTNLPEEWRDIDILVNNAGLAKGLSPIQEGELRHWEQMIDTNIKGLLYVTRCIAPMMAARRSGHIINICSVAGKEVYPNGNVYCATKSAVDALTRSTRIDLHKYGIRVGQVSPGHVEETEFAVNRFDGDTERAKIYEDFQPLRSADVADAIFYMTSRPAHVNILDMDLFGTQQASATIVDRSGR